MSPAASACITVVGVNDRLSDRSAAPLEGAVASLAALPDVSLVQGEPLSRHTTLRVGGAPSAFLRAETVDAVVACVRGLDDAGVPLLVLGGGSNLVLADDGLDRAVVAVRAAAIDLDAGAGPDAAGGPGTAVGPDAAIDPETAGGRVGDAPEVGGVVVRAEAGAVWDDLVRATVEAGLGGLECLSGIPGSVGATPVQNVGAYGVEVAQVLHRVRVLDRTTGEDAWLAPAALGLAYRTSRLKGTDDGVVLAVEFLLRPDGLSAPVAYRELAARLGVAQGERVPAAEAREVVLGLRRGKGMVLDADDHDTWSAGSFFTNPVVPGPGEAGGIDAVREKVAARLGDEEAAAMPAFEAPGGIKLSAGWLIERAGFAKGYPGEDAPARLSTKHTLALTNRGPATSADIAALARDVRVGVEEAFGVRLHPEPVWVGCSIDG